MRDNTHAGIVFLKIKCEELYTVVVVNLYIYNIKYCTRSGLAARGFGLWSAVINNRFRSSLTHIGGLKFSSFDQFVFGANLMMPSLLVKIWIIDNIKHRFFAKIGQIVLTTKTTPGFSIRLLYSQNLLDSSEPLGFNVECKQEWSNADYLL